ncbi:MULTISPECIES: LysR substrate-binding domain-containing protein [Paraburkholderia]|uniref:LysR substrate-binding domain-containing protein n=1 Tax=Paraburkholderia TaxID=1822464 RepID=UPI0006D3CBB7|nr:MULTISPECIES: LysR substrate-binding domain-containing protein [Paraburkholderia]ALP67614.1 transcriptional regulator [Paraburkholderia caribensis]AUT57346.1 transcriptional regulator [Paraburkholderia caribensis]CAG9221048.1 Transcriptional regulator [Paraburkholderia caribensis]
MSTQALPSINHLRSFQVIGHHLNLVHAARELHLSPSALSYQLGVLEERLGTRLFTRTGRGLAFTEAGRLLHGEVDQCLQRLWSAWQRVAANERPAPLVVNSLPTFAMHWLLPRLTAVQEQFANVEIRVSIAQVDLEREALDCAIAYGDGHWPGVHCDFLREESLIVVCSPDTLSANGPLSSVADLARFTLLSAKTRPDDWTVWADAAQQPLPPGGRQLLLASRNMVIQAACENLGVAVVDPAMVRTELSSGRLVQALPQTAKGQGAYYLVYPAGEESLARVAAFRAWLLAEMARDTAAGLSV